MIPRGLTRLFEAVGRAEQRFSQKSGRYVIPLVTLVLVAGLMAALFLNRDRVSELGNWGYLGAFLLGLVTNATVILPMPGLLLLFALGASFNPFLIGVASATGGAIGELTGYALGYTGHVLIEDNKMYSRIAGWMKKWGAAVIFVFAASPFLLLDLAGITAGITRFSVWKFLLACWAGKIIMFTAMALLGAWGWDAVQAWFV